MFRDEVENGTFLTMLSKPYSRRGLLSWKFLAYFIVNTLFLFTSILAIIIPILIFGHSPESDITHTVLKSDLGITIGIFLLTGFIVGLIMSSITLLISTKLPSQAVVAIGIFIAIIGWASNIFGVATSAPAYSSDLQINNIKFNENLQKKRDLITDETAWTKYETFAYNMYKAIYSESSTNLINNTSYEGGGLSGLEILIDKPKSPAFSVLAYFDLTYQIKQLGNVINKNEFPDSIEFTWETPRKQKPLMTYDQTTAPKIYNNINKIINDGNQYILENFGSLPKSEELLINWNDVVSLGSLFNSAKNLSVDSYEPEMFFDPNQLTPSEKIQMILFGTAQADLPGEELPTYTPDPQKYASILETNRLVKIKYVDYINKYGLLATYLSLTAILLPLTFYILKRIDVK